MKTSRIILLFIVTFFIAIVAYVLGISNQHQEYKESIHAYWRSYEASLKFGSDSPVKDLSTYKPIEYFEPEMDYKVQGKLDLLENNEPVILLTSDEGARRYTKYASISFSLLGKQHQLTLLQNQLDENDYFLPFFDLTNGVTTYGAGRYLSVELNSLKTIELDFNKTTNPYCAYNEDYSCPIPPQENFLPVQVLAGQKYVSPDSH